MSKQHVQLPHNMTESRKLAPNDLLVYLSIKRYMNSKTKQAFPSLRTLSDKCGFSIDTIRKSIKKLEEESWIKITEDGRKNIYTFSTQKGLFERFSFDFLDNEVPPKEKAYLVASQQFMIKEHNVGKTSYSDKELSEKINLSEYRIKTYDKSLEKDGVLTVLKSDTLDENGISKNIKFFHLEELGQALLFVNDKVDKLAGKQEENNSTLKFLLKKVKDLEDKLQTQINEDEIDDAIIME